MIITLILLTIVGFFPQVWRTTTESNFTTAILRWISIIAMIYAMIVLYNIGEKEASIKCLDGNPVYEKQYISNDTGVIDSIYIKIK